MQLESLTVSDGVSYYYLDSGHIPGNTYTTLVFVPGMGFNGGVFRKLFPLASAHRLRIVSLYRRDYNPTTSFSDVDLAGLVSRTVEGQESFLRNQAVDIATFLVMFAHEQRIPLAEGTRGGIALVGWSLGSLLTHAVVAHLDALPYDVLSDLEKYFHTMVCHDVSGIFIGIPWPPSLSMEYWSETDVEKRFKLFYEWVAGHFLHKNATSGSIDDLEFYKSTDKPHSMHELSPGELAELTSAETFGGSDTLLVAMQLDVFKATTRRAIFDPALAEKFLPNLRVRYMCGGTSPNVIVWTLHELRKCLADPKPIYGPDAEKARDVKFKFQTEGNHFIFWDEPEVALEQYIAAINLSK
jgi:pimeloyl-ACP methyl ester carboxylesterase